MNVIILSIAVLGATGIVAALILYVVSKRFKVEENPLIDEVEAILPGANCGGCGYSGCRAFATACCNASSLEGLTCPGAGSEGMKKIADLLGLTPAVKDPVIAVIKCNGTCDVRSAIANYDGPLTCASVALTGVGESGCPNGCLGCGDCVAVCRFNAIYIDPTTGLPVVDEEKCTGCGVCTKACPRTVIELRPKGRRGLRVWVACNNREKGAVAMKACKAACIGCSKCEKVCTHEAITVSNNLSWIDPQKCKLCRKCVDVCPTHAILTANFPVKVVAPTTNS